jgi:hypothetical protein
VLTIRCRRLSMFRKNWRSRLEELPTEERRGFVIAQPTRKRAMERCSSLVWKAS